MVFIENVIRWELNSSRSSKVLFKKLFTNEQVYITQYLKKNRKIGCFKKAEKALVKNPNLLC
jgi:hypothetical protein